MSDLTVWAREHYASLKDFAGPISTLIASIAASIVAYTLGRSQRKIAELQTAILEKTWKTANDKIVLELFHPRMEIYDAISAVVGKAHSGRPAANELYFGFSQAVQRAPFYFGEDVTAYLDKLRNLIIDIEETKRLCRTLQIPITAMP